MSVVKVYNTEANARAGGGTGLVSNNGTGGVSNLTFGGVTFHSGFHNSLNSIPYFIFEKYFYRIEANEPVLEFHIDWDDGEDNSRAKRNVQVVKFDDPVNFCVVDHVYTTAGLKFPMFRVKSIEGFLSKWYIHGEHTAALNPSLTPYLDEINSSVTLTTGQNDFSKVSLDKSDKGGIPVFAPQNVPPICIMKSDKKRIFAGIANNILQQNFESGTQYALLYAFSDTPASFSGTLPKIKLTVETDDKHINEYVIDPSNIVTINSLTGNTNNFTNADSGGLSRGNATSQMATMMVPFGNYNKSNGGGTNEARRVVRAEILETNDFPDDARIYIHALNVGASYTRSNVDVDENRTVCILSNGNPIVDSLDPMFSANVDASESYNRSSAHGISKYLIDDDTLGCYNSRGMKVFSGTDANYPASHKSIQDASTVNSSASALRHPTDILKGTELSMFDRGTNPTLNVAYTHGSHGHRKDADGRFLDFYRLVRGQVRGTDAATQTNELPDGNYSQLSNHKRNTYTSTVDSGLIRIPSQYGTNALIMFSNSDTYVNANQSSGTAVTGIADADWKNIGSTIATSNQHMITSYTSFGDNSNGDNTLKLSDGETTTADSNTTTQPPNNYLFICQPDKFDKIHFRTNNYNLARNVVGSSFPNDADCNTNIQDINFTAWYMGPDGWEILDIVDRTNGFSNSGSISFKRPADWTLATKSAWGTTGPVASENTTHGTANVDPENLWDFNAYAILIGINVNTNTNLYTQITQIWPFSNEHSQYIKVVDPHHVSLNSIAIAQSISFNRQGKFQTITDRFGKSEIRKMGVNGGKVTFGSVDLGDTDAQGNRKKIKRYQQNATPVFLDVTHKSGEKTRFFGVITSMSEDHPTGKQNPKYAVQMQVSHLIEMSSTGALLSDKISIGGNIDDTRQYRTSA